MMPVRVIAYKSLQRAIEALAGHPDQGAVRSALLAWHDEVRRADWSTPAALKALYRNASVVGGDRVVFNIKGNDYRLVVAVDYARRLVFVKWFGSHAAYDRIDARTVAHGD